MDDNDFFSWAIEQAPDPEPLPDMAQCGACDWEGSVDGCEQEEDGDWETGYYMVDLCPKCGEHCEYYYMSDEQFKNWLKWKGYVKCHDCGGTGRRSIQSCDGDDGTCYTCRGEGLVRK